MMLQTNRPVAFRACIQDERNSACRILTDHEPPPGVLTDNEKVAFVRRSGRRISAGLH
jgi:hypothetical protein